MNTKNILILISVILYLSALVFLLYKDDIFKNLKGDDIEITKIPSFNNAFYNLNISDIESNTLLVPDLESVGITKDGDYSDALKECASNNSDRTKIPSTCSETSVEYILGEVEGKGDTFSNFIKNYVKHTAGEGKVGSPDGFYAAFKDSGGSWNKVLTANVGANDAGEAICESKLGSNAAYNKVSGTCVAFEPADPKNFKDDLTPGDDTELFKQCKKSISSSLNYKETLPDTTTIFQVSDISKPKRCSLGSAQITDVGSQAINKWVRTNQLKSTSQVPPYHVIDGDRIITIGNPLQTSDPITLLQNSGGHVCIGFTENADIPWLPEKDLPEKERKTYDTEDLCYEDFPCDYLSRIRNPNDKVCNVNLCQHMDKDVSTDEQKKIKWSDLYDDDPMWISAKKGCFRKLSSQHPLEGKRGKCECSGYNDCAADHGRSTMEITQDADEQMLKVKCYNKGGNPFGCAKCEGVLTDNLALKVDKTIGNFSTPHYWCARQSLDGSWGGPGMGAGGNYYWKPSITIASGAKGEVNGVIDTTVNSSHLSKGERVMWENNPDIVRHPRGYDVMLGCSPDKIPDQIKMSSED